MRSLAQRQAIPQGVLQLVRTPQRWRMDCWRYHWHYLQQCHPVRYPRREVTLPTRKLGSQRTQRHHLAMSMTAADHHRQQQQHSQQVGLVQSLPPHQHGSNQMQGDATQRSPSRHNKARC